MNTCPVCKSPLHPTNYQGVDFKVCKKCGGVWLTPVSLQGLVGLLADKTHGEFVRSTTATQFTPHQEPDKKCPACSRGLTEFQYAYNSNIYLDRCENDGGIWIDGKEVDLLSKLVDDKTQEVFSEFALQSHVSQEKWKNFLKDFRNTSERVPPFRRMVFLSSPIVMFGWMVNSPRLRKAAYVLLALILITAVIRVYFSPA